MRRPSLLILLAIGLFTATRPCAVAGETASLPSALDREVSFERDVQPILAARCLECHGPDAQESDFRLDRRDDALRGGLNGKAILPGDGAGSALVQRVAGLDPDLQMPPDGEPLSREHVAILRTWIDQGASWPAETEGPPPTAETHWSLRPLVRPEIPKAPAARISNPIDAFIAAKLAEHGLSQSPPADRRTLIRRLTVDLIGLLPTPEEVVAFESDDASDAYEKVVDRLLSSPHFGERWARHWMDVVHFAETHGNDQDRPRPNAWPYRDYLIQSFNDDKPYAQFVAEQVAGDVLYPNDPQATVALGFLAAGPWDESSHANIVDDTVDKKIAQLLDRDDMLSTVMSTFVSATVHCARCHNHKFDPISQTDYYALQSVFSGVDRADRLYDPDPEIHVRRQALLRQKKRINSPDIDCKEFVELLENPVAFAKLEQEFAAHRERLWQVVKPASVSTASGASALQLEDGSLLFSGDRSEKDVYTIELDLEVDGITALRLEALPDASLPFQGPGRQDNGNFHLSELKLAVVSADGEEVAPIEVDSAFADFSQADWPVSAAVDGNIATAWGIYPEVGQSHTATFVFEDTLKSEGRARLRVVLEQQHGGGHLIGRPRISVTTTARPRDARPVPLAISTILDAPPANRTAAQVKELARFLLTWQVDEQLALLPKAHKVYAVTNDFKPEANFRPTEAPRPVHILRRGDVRQPLDEATPGALACIGDLQPRFSVADAKSEGERRAALGRWLIDPRNVLAWRSIVNRVWAFHFHRGIVDSPNDLGKMGGEPSHPELLDWLAVEFRDHGGSLKKLHRLIVTSDTYRQSSRSHAQGAALDADNRLLWRMNGARMDAECIRDAVLQVSGRLDLTMGGPSVKQFIQTPGIHVTPNVDYQNFDLDSPACNRRSVYRFLFRTLPDPFMESLGCPDGSQLCPVRDESFTALQALSLLNNRFIVRQSEHAADRLAKVSRDLAEQINALYLSALSREPTAEESWRWKQYAQRHGMANVCRLLFNSNEFVFVQ